MNSSRCGPVPLRTLCCMRAIAWDMDGTLVDTEPRWGIATYEMATLMGVDLTPEQRAVTVGGTAENTISTCLEFAGQTPNPGLIDTWKTWFFARMGEILSEGFDFRPGFPELLHDIHDAGIPQALVTNTARSLVDHCLPVIGDEFFATSVAEDEVPRGKPYPDGYARACDLMDVNPDDVLVVEDSPTGMSAARAAGCRVLGVPVEPGLELPEGIKTLHELRGVTSFALRDGHPWRIDDFRELWNEL